MKIIYRKYRSVNFVEWIKNANSIGHGDCEHFNIFFFFWLKEEHKYKETSILPGNCHGVCECGFFLLSADLTVALRMRSLNLWDS